MVITGMTALHISSLATRQTSGTKKDQYSHEHADRGLSVSITPVLSLLHTPCMETAMTADCHAYGLKPMAFHFRLPPFLSLPLSAERS